MNITLIVGSLSQGGAERVASNVANYLADNGHSVEVLMTSKEISYPIKKGVNTYCFTKDWTSSMPHPLQNVFRVLTLFSHMKTSKSDVYICLVPKLSKLILRNKFLLDAPFVVAERADPSQYWIEDPQKEKESWKIMSSADGYMFQTVDAKDYYASKGVNVTNSAVIPNAINPDFIRPRYVGVRKKVIVTSGRLNDQKNHTLLINAFAQIADKYPEYNLCIYGEGEKRKELLALVRHLGLDNRIYLPGYSTSIIEKLQEASMFVLPSDFEGMPNALMEAMALGLPCVSTDCGGGGARFLIENGKNGLLVPQKDVDAMAAAMDRILSDQEFAEKLGAEAHKLCDTLAPEKIYGEWEKYIESLIIESKAK